MSLPESEFPRLVVLGEQLINQSANFNEDINELMSEFSKLISSLHTYFKTNPLPDEVPSEIIDNATLVCLPIHRDSTILIQIPTPEDNVSQIYEVKGGCDGISITPDSFKIINGNISYPIYKISDAIKNNYQNNTLRKVLAFPTLLSSFMTSSKEIVKVHE